MSLIKSRRHLPSGSRSSLSGDEENSSTSSNLDEDEDNDSTSELDQISSESENDDTTGSAWSVGPREGLSMIMRSLEEQYEKKQLRQLLIVLMASTYEDDISSEEMLKDAGSYLSTVGDYFDSGLQKQQDEPTNPATPRTPRKEQSSALMSFLSHLTTAFMSHSPDNKNRKKVSGISSENRRPFKNTVEAVTDRVKRMKLKNMQGKDDAITSQTTRSALTSPESNPEGMIHNPYEILTYRCSSAKGCWKTCA